MTSCQSASVHCRSVNAIEHWWKILTKVLRTNPLEILIDTQLDCCSHLCKKLPEKYENHYLK